jgi:hypothetical protein
MIKVETAVTRRTFGYFLGHPLQKPSLRLVVMFLCLLGRQGISSRARARLCFSSGHRNRGMLQIFFKEAAKLVADGVFKALQFFDRSVGANPWKRHVIRQVNTQGNHICVEAPLRIGNVWSLPVPCGFVIAHVTFPHVRGYSYRQNQNLKVPIVYSLSTLLSIDH